MEAGKVIHRFIATDKREVTLRTLKWEHLDDLLEMINSLVAEKADIFASEKVTRAGEIDWLSQALSNQEKGETFYLVAEVKGKAIANSEINRHKRGYDSHVGKIGIAIRKGYRDVGIGTQMMKALIKQARRMKLKVLTLSAFETNKRAIHVYENAGFVQTGYVPHKFLREGKYVNEVIMAFSLDKVSKF